MKQKLYLDGLWDFHFEEIPPQDYQIEKVKYETVMTVPGCFDTQPQYRFKRGVGFFRTKVNCGGKVKLEIGGLGLRARIYWDGRLVGSSELPYSKIELYFDAGAETIEHELVIAVDHALQLMTKMAHEYDNHDLIAFLNTNEGHYRVRALRHLAGGNHRMYILLSEFLTKESLDDLVTAFEQLAEELTPYFQERVRSLTSASPYCTLSM